MLDPGALVDLDPDLYRTILARAKRQIRSRMRALRSAIGKEAHDRRNQQVCERILTAPWFEKAQSVGLFWPITARSEVDLRPIDRAARAGNKRVFYPFLEDLGDRMRTGFRLVDDPAALVDDGQGFLEPPTSAPEASRADLDVVFVPALAVTPSGDRLGYGKGFYDVTLPDFCPPARSVAVAFDFQVLGELPTSELDVRCNVVVTDKRTFSGENAE